MQTEGETEGAAVIEGRNRIGMAGEASPVFRSLYAGVINKKVVNYLCFINIQVALFFLVFFVKSTIKYKYQLICNLILKYFHIKNLKSKTKLKHHEIIRNRETQNLIPSIVNETTETRVTHTIMS